MTDFAQELYDENFDKQARLSNGGLVHLHEAAGHWDTLRSLAMYPKDKRVMLELRDRALDVSAFTDPKRREYMTNMGFLAADGCLKPAARDVVLSSLTGDLMDTHVVSPFTAWGDRKMAEFINGVRHVQKTCAPGFAERVLKEVLGTEWVRRIQDRPPGLGGPGRN